MRKMALIFQLVAFLEAWLELILLDRFRKNIVIFFIYTVLSVSTLAQENTLEDQWIKFEVIPGQVSLVAMPSARWKVIGSKDVLNFYVSKGSVYLVDESLGLSTQLDLGNNYFAASLPTSSVMYNSPKIRFDDYLYLKQDDFLRRVGVSAEQIGRGLGNILCGFIKCTK